MSADPRIEAAKESVYESLCEVVYTCSRSWEAWNYGTMTDEDFAPAWEDDTLIGEIAEAVVAAIDKAATIKQFTGAEVNIAGWVCGACEPGDYAKCEDCQSACDDVAQFVNRMIRGTE